MEIFDLTSLSIVTENPDADLMLFTDFYDLTQATFQSRNDVQLQPYYVQIGEEMRIDLICNNIYGNTDNIDILLNINEIFNPLNLHVGDLIMYPAIKDIPLYQVNPPSQQAVISTLLNINKATKTDPNRQQYIQQNYSLPPTVLPQPVEPVKISGNNIVIGAGLF